jgi:hypothetical protein
VVGDSGLGVSDHSVADIDEIVGDCTDADPAFHARVPFMPGYTKATSIESGFGNT